MKRLIILDRDGVINQDSDQYIKSVEEFIPISGSLEAIARLCQANFSVRVATNQSGIARGLFTLATLEKMHEKLQNLLLPLEGNIDGFYYCPHAPEDHCTCRKPKSGLIKQIANDFFAGKSPQFQQEQLAKTYVIGDSLRDLDAGKEAGTKIALVKTGKGIRSLQTIAQEHLSDYSQVPIYNNLSDFTDYILAINDTEIK